MSTQDATVAQTEKAFREALALRPDSPAAHNNFGVFLMQVGRLAESEVILRKAIALRPDSADIALNLGAVLFQLKRFADAEPLVRRALTLRPGFAMASHVLGCILRDSGRADLAEIAFHDAIALQPQHFDAHISLGAIARSRGRLAEAEEISRRAIEIRPTATEAHCLLGDVMFNAGRDDEALASYRQVLALDPTNGFGHCGVALVQQRRGEWAEAELCLRRAISLQPESFEARLNLSALLTDFNRLQEAETWLREAIALRPQSAGAKVGLGILLLRMGRYKEGWEFFEERNSDSFDYATFGLIERKARAVSIVAWQGESLQDKSLLVVFEQGLGDAIQFVRFMPLLKTTGVARLTVACNHGLFALFQGVEGIDSIIDIGVQPGAADYDRWCFSMSVPGLMHMTLHDIPWRAPYVKLPSERLKAWAKRMSGLSARRSLKVGLTWAGSPALGNFKSGPDQTKLDALRSLHFRNLLPLLDNPSVTFFSLQHGKPRTQLAEVSPHGEVIDLMNDANDLVDTACIIEQLDLVISVDTSVAHLTGALGKPVWILNRFSGDWRWLDDREDSPWYPSARLFRQKRRGDWDEVIERVRDSLIKLAMASVTT
ncbi:tetratricopeptide repeat protein [Caballeronia sp. GAFFF2]|uniref:tetratricopeptide repeat protein n=1 Tax=Caballeronia sp. GAFFF2 TaxID=2921741 RepID=UPI0020280AF0|nr:tetratricopeptide repeat protein [Caballeronia sp. GAFFF2]